MSMLYMHMGVWKALREGGLEEWRRCFLSPLYVRTLRVWYGVGHSSQSLTISYFISQESVYLVLDQW